MQKAEAVVAKREEQARQAREAHERKLAEAEAERARLDPWARVTS